MPKYAANLSVAPLQPQKQLSASNMNFKNDAVSVEISVNKPGTWTDPFAADGQECKLKKLFVIPKNTEYYTSKLYLANQLQS